MPRTLPAELTAAMDAGNFTAYLAIGRRDYTGTPPSALSGYTTLITEILYYEYDGLNLTVKYHSANLPATDGLNVGDKYYIERGVTVSGTNYTIKSASLRFDDYVIHKQIVTAFFSLFSPDEKPNTVDGDDTYTNVLTNLNPNDYWLGTVDFKPTYLNFAHWDYNFFPSGKIVDLKSYASLLPLIRQKYLLRAVDNSDDDNEDEIQFFHLVSPTNSRVWTEPTITARTWSALAWSETLGIMVIGGTAYFAWSEDGTSWAEVNQGTGTWGAIAWSDDLARFAALSNTHRATSTDGKTWGSLTHSYGANWIGMCRGDELGYFIAVHSNDEIYYSANGLGWSYVNAPTGANLYCCAYSPSLKLFVVMGASVCHTSPDGTNWTQRTVPAKNWTDVTWSPALGLFCAVASSGEIITSDDGITWNSETPGNSLFRYGITWSPYLGLFLAVAQSGTGNRLLYSTDGENWTEGDTGTDADWYKVAWAESLHSFVIICNSGATVLTTSFEAIAEDFEIQREDVRLQKDNLLAKFIWRDENSSTHEAGADTSLVHNLGYLESTDDPPDSYASSERGSVTLGIHLKYKTGDIFKLAINSSQYAIYLGKVTEILDPKNRIGWRTEIQLIERFSNTNAGAMPSTIERVAAYTPLVTTNFDGNLDETVNNLQAFAERVDDMDLGDLESALPAASAKTTPADADLFALLDSAASYILKKITWSNIKATLKTYFDLIYSSITHNHDSDYVDVTGDTMTGQLLIDLGSNTIGARIQADASQTANILSIEKSDGTVWGGFDENGILFSHGGTHANNIFLGEGAGNTSATGQPNMAIGNTALRDLTTGIDNFAFGVGAGRTLTTGTGNVFLGSYSGWSVSTGVANNMYIGAYSGQSVGGGHNVGIGTYAIQNGTGANYVTAIGEQAGRASGSRNVFIGYRAGLQAANDNIFLGHQAGMRYTGSNRLIIDYKDRTTAAAEATDAILYGVLASSPGNQALSINAILSLTQINSGATQAAAGAAAGEIWKTSGHATLPDNVLMIGV